MRAEIKDLETGHIGNAFLIEQGENYLVKPYMLESDGEGNFYHRYYTPYVLCKEMEGFEYTIYIQEER